MRPMPYKQFSMSALGQASMSVQSLALTAIIARGAGAAALGEYAIFVTFSLLLLGIQNALICTPAAVYRSLEQEKSALQRTFNTANYVLCASVFIFSVTLQAAFGGSLHQALSTSTFFITILVREYAKASHFANGQQAAPLISDLVFCVLSISSSAGLFMLDAAPVTALFWSQSLCAVIASAPLYTQNPPYRACPPRTFLRTYRPIAKEAAWSLTGVGVTEIHSRGYVYLVAACFGTESLGYTQAIRALFQPVGVLVAAWNRVARVKVADFIASGRTTDAGLLLENATKVALAGTIFYCIAILSLSQKLITLLLGESPPDAWPIALAWAVATTAVALRGMQAVGMQAYREFRMLTIFVAGAALTSLLGLYGAITSQSLALAILSSVPGDLGLSAAVWITLRARKRSRVKMASTA